MRCRLRSGGRDLVWNSAATESFSVLYDQLVISIQMRCQSKRRLVNLTRVFRSVPGKFGRTVKTWQGADGDEQMGSGSLDRRGGNLR